MRTAIVTGSSSGVGLAVAVELASRGWHVIGLDLGDGAALRGAAKFAGVGETVGHLETDITDRTQVSLSMARITASFGDRLGALVNCAEVSVSGPFDEMSDRGLRQQFDLNLKGAMNVTRAALPALRSTAGSRIVNLSSTAGLAGVPGMAGFSGSKWGLEGWTEAIAHELHPLGVGVALVEPPVAASGPGGTTGGDLDQIAVADAVVAAVEGRRRLRQPVGFSARARCAARGVVASGLQSAVVARSMGLEAARPPVRHDDGVVLVTGASTGFGLEIVVELARRGRRVAATMRDTSRRERLDEALVADGLLERVEILQMDVTDPGSIYDVFTVVDRWEQVAGEKGRLVGVVNNAGVRAVGAFEEIPPVAVEHMMEVNLFGTIAVTRAALACMRPHGGRIVFVSSSSALVGEPTWAAYAATKWAVEGWVESLAFETAPNGIGLVLVEPGAFGTDLNRAGTSFGSEDGPYHLMHEAMTEADRRQLERGGDPVDVARVVATAFDSRRLPTRRPVGRDARLRWFTRGVVPQGVQRWVRDRTLGLQ
ncbi:MAG: SDR family NAD(P)-dependent oxidoreductase [Actinobacteria bacterium]|jgi:NAD(P)-dependent dehydrogenase (short-subunit alcohol dehydrogenase family)|nr:SDR family NAD(P)-dependent oxidoreductase [Actinomycetota bacterium]MBT3687199.1 SDR family NAD(P)-dependent oxidoreductase [Actinomycetota bacterium]MBT4037934.1 SDR family NAD(P)-dependent oxidoreductase [Actinomycetota bacterium]MBT4279911.1 SDR family NAD(P)-dependent oxidoreductase [Actinomycetota bacterium]MBT4342785.1 SDR family NAD(P)-dependent oxidoreductase [Actinomycetota bacterium]